MIAINLIVVSQDEGVYETVMRGLEEEHLIPDVIRADSVRETMALLAGEIPRTAEKAETSGESQIQPLLPENLPEELPLPRQGDTEEELRYIRMFVRLHLCEELSLSRIARKIGFSTSHLCHMFRAGEGVTLQKFIERSRMERAAYLLETENSLVEEIARRTGYRNASYFSKIFSQYFGDTPLRYRKKRRHEIRR